MKGERQAESHGAYRTPAPGGPCPHTRGLDGAPEELRNRYALQHISACGLSHIVGSCPILVIVARETPDTAHTRHVGEDTDCPHASAAHACLCQPGQCGHGLFPTLPGGYPPQAARHHAPPLAARLAMRPRLLRGPVLAHPGLAPGSGSRGGPARSGGSRDRGAPGQTSGVSAFSTG
jgi:hypothetical protein